MAELIPKLELKRALNADWVAVNIYESHVTVHMIRDGVKSSCDMPVLQVLAHRPASARVDYAVACFDREKGLG